MTKNDKVGSCVIGIHKNIDNQTAATIIIIIIRIIITTMIIIVVKMTITI